MGLYTQFQSSGFDSAALKSQATQELNTRAIELYGTSDIATIVNGWQINPATIPTDGVWGFSHAAITLFELEVMRLGGATDAALIQYANEQIRRWYAREFNVRCMDGVAEPLNPLTWDKPAPGLEDSRLDYWTPRVFVEWYIAQL